MLDETVELDEGQSRGLWVQVPRPAQIDIQVHAAPEKVDVYLMTEAEYEKFKSILEAKSDDKSFTYRQALSATAVLDFRQSDSVPAGKWHFVIYRPQESKLITDKTRASIKILMR